MCMTPYGVKDKITGSTIPVPCGKCPLCVARRTSQWSFRILQEEKISQSAYFLTLTYDTKHVPLTRSGYMTIKKRDVQLFFKRLRKAHGEYYREFNPKTFRYVKKWRSSGPAIKYYTVGEYGSKYNRPHYHAIVFNAQVEKIQPAWELGHVYYGTVTGGSVGYCLKYMCKKGKIPMHAKDDRIKEFGLMSKGLGKNYITEAMRKWHLSDMDNRMYCNLTDGKKISMPRYYKDKIYTEEQRKRIAFFQKLRYENEQREAEKSGGENYWHFRAEAVKAAFISMDYKSSQGGKL